MKRRIITTVAVCVFLALVLAVRLSDREKIDNSIPSKETVAAYILEKGEQYAAEQLRAQDRDSLRRSWESRTPRLPGSGQMCGTLMRTQRFLYSMMQKMMTR